MSKGLEIFNKLLGSKGISNEDFETIKKELKALEIIVNKRVNVAYLIYCIETFDYEEGFALEQYNLSCFKDEWKLTQEEYDLLKGVLL